MRFQGIFKIYVVKISRVFNPNLDTFVHKESTKSRITFHQLIENGFPLEHLWTWYVGTSVQNIFQIGPLEQMWWTNQKYLET